MALQGKKNPDFFIFLHRLGFHAYILAFYNFFFTLRIAKNKTKVFPPVILIRNFPKESKLEIFFIGISPKFSRESYTKLVFSTSLESRTNLIYFRAVDELHAGSSISVFADPSTMQEILPHLKILSLKAWQRVDLLTSCFSTFSFKPFYINLLGLAILIHNLFGTSFCTTEMVRIYLAPIQRKMEMEKYHCTLKKKSLGKSFTFYFPFQWLKTEIPCPRMPEIQITE